MNVLQWGLALFAAVALGGLSLALLIGLRIRFPRWCATAHGLLGLLGLLVLFAANLHGGDALPPLAWWALGVLLAALCGGLILFRTLFRARAPRPAVLVHGALALLGIYLLYRAAFAG
ncbi:hypothetical protein NRY95_19395 [Xanthomonas campestris pv. phormiicola]|nr:hypothetical protein [Xanthomonas campestris pv. phormiicola]UYC15828.1 hypothetical protein NRY95_19395 [Xanthomonas campestris pv. phormiicola]